ncbi:MAG: hypothetical protein SR1Q5_06120, partial [Quinella sp. 1Q5]|nr:hypothetical protein [Quinella sp. 1Q5]
MADILNQKSGYYDSGDYVTINAGDDADSIVNSGSYVKINAGDGNDTIVNYGNAVSITGGKGNDLFYNSGRDVIFICDGSGRDDYDTIYGFDKNSILIFGGRFATLKSDGKDNFLTYVNGKVTFKNLKGTAMGIKGMRDYLYGSGVLNNQWYNYLNDSVLEAGYGDDTIFNYADNVVFKYFSGDDKDSIIGFNETSTLSISDGMGSYSTEIVNNDVIVNVGGGIGDITLVGAAALPVVNINGIRSFDPSKIITLNEGVDNYSNTVEGATIKALGGNDSIRNEGKNVSISAGDGNDFIDNYGSKVIVNGGSGNDTLRNNGGTNVLFVYNGGNDSIAGFNGTSMLSISGGLFYSTQKSGSDVIVTVGDGKITLQGAATLPGIRIYGKALNEYTKVGTERADSIDSTLEGATIVALGGNDSITNNKDKVSINAGAGNDFISNYWQYSDKGGVSITVDAGDGKDYIYNYGNYASLNGGDGDDTISNPYAGRYSTIEGGAGNDSISNESDKVSIDGGAGNDYISNSNHMNSGLNNKGTISGGEGNDTIRNIRCSYVTISGDAGNDSITNSEGYYAVFNYAEGDGNDTIQGFNETSTLSISGSSYSTTKSDNGIIVTVGEGSVLLKNVTNLSSSNVIFENPNSIPAGIDEVIFNYDDNITLVTGFGNDSIYNSGANVLFFYEGGNDSIQGFNETSTLSISGSSYSTTKSGNDIIVTVGESKITLFGAASLEAVNISNEEIQPTDPVNPLLITLTEGNDSYRNTVEGATIQALGGDDSINNSAANVYIDLDSGADSVTNDSLSSNASIISGDENDYIDNKGTNVLIDSGAGNDTAWNYGKYATIDGGAGDDTIWNSGNESSINGGAGDDSIYNIYNYKFTIDGGEGNDYIRSGGSNVSMDGGSGNDSIESNLGINVLINGGDGNDSIYYYGDNPVSQGGVENTNTTILGGSGDDSIDNFGDGATIDSGAGNNEIYNGGKNVSIEGGDDDDAVYNFGEYGWNEETKEYDRIVKVSDNATINTRAGSDYIENISSFVSINAGAGNDTILNWIVESIVSADSVTIAGGAGDDSIINEGNNVLFQYNTGDGNDTIIGFNATSTLQIGNGTGTYSTQVSGSDVIVNIDNSAITLVGAASLSSINIAGEEVQSVEPVNPLLITLTENADRYSNKQDGATILGGAGNDFIDNWGYDKVIMTGDDGADTIANYSGNEVFISGGAGNDSLRNHVGNNVTIRGGDGNDYIRSNIGSNISIEGGTGDDTISLGNEATNVLIEYTSGDGNDIVYNFNSDDTLQIGGGTGTYSTQISGSDIIVTVDKGKITLVGAATLESINISGEDTFNLQWILEGTTATCIMPDGISISISGIKSTEGITIGDDGKVAVDKNNLAEGATEVKLTGKGYSLELTGVETVGTPTTSSATFSEIISSGANYFTTTNTNAYWTLGDDNNYILTPAASVNNILFTLSGIKTTSGIVVDTIKKTVTLKSANLGASDVKFSANAGGYTFGLEGVSGSTTTTAGFSGNTYKTGSNTAGYALDNAKTTVKYTSAVPATDLFTLSGIKTTSGIVVDTIKKTVTLKSANLGASDVKFSANAGG